MKKNSLNLKWFLFACGLLLSVNAFSGGSIVINAAAPASDLVYQEDSGQSKALKVTWNDIQVIDAMRRFMSSQFGALGADQPFYINRKTSKVSYLNPNTQQYDEVSFRELLRGQ